MAATANTTPPTTTTTTITAAASTLSPRSPASIARTASPPWTQIVRGPDPEPLPPSSPSAAAGEGQVEGGESNAGVSKKPAWNKKPMPTSSLSNGAVEGGAGVTPAVVMDAELWPALSESTKASPRRLTVDSSKNLPDFGSIQVTGSEVASAATVSSPVRSPSLTSQKPTNSNLNHHPTSNHGRPVRQKSMKRDGAANPQANGGFSHPQPQSPGEGSNHGQRDSHQRNSLRRGNGGRGDGSHQNYGGRRSDQDRGNHDWNHQRSFNGRDASMQPRGAPRGFVRPQAVSSSFAPPPPVRPFMNPMMPDMPLVFLPPGVQFIAPVPPMFFPVPDPELYSKIMAQIDYYFSNDNLVKDTYLRRNMDENGWVSVNLIAGFKKVQNLTKDSYQILDAVRSSTVVEVQGDKIRKRDDWARWLMPPTVQFPTVSSSQSASVPAVSTVAAHIQSVTLDAKTNDHTNAKGEVDASAPALLQSSSGDLNSSSKTTKDEASSSGC